MSRRLRALIALGLFILSLIVSACGPSDGEGYFHILYTNSQGEQRKIYIKDTYQWNGIHVDEANHQLYCPDASIIKMPTVAHSGGGSGHITIGVDLMAETVCDMGQEEFDEFWQGFDVTSGEE